MKKIVAILAALFLSVSASADNCKRMGAGEAFAYSAVFGVAAYAIHGKAVDILEDSNRYRARAAYELEVKPNPFYQEHYFNLTGAAGRIERKSARLTAVSNGLAVVALSFLVRGLVSLRYDGDAVTVQKEWRF